MRAPILLAALGAAACEPSDATYVEAAKREIGNVGCGVDGGAVAHCMELDGAKVVSSRVEGCCADSGAMVYLGMEGPNGKALCTFQMMKAGLGTVRLYGGGCRVVK